TGYHPADMPAGGDFSSPEGTVREEDLQGVKVLIAEDNIVNQKVAQRICEKIGVIPTIAADGEQAVQALYKTSFDIVLMDVQMPVLDGYEATERIRRDPPPMNEDIPVIAMTANAMQGDKDRCLRSGMNDYISKPVKPADIRSKIREWVLSGGS
ncbi:MAG: response regulator, partial [Fibrobacterota bacterium]